eukprot:SAG22_NODE_3151_length_1902_cov_1.774265_1_plen_478_part_00
MSGGQAEPDGPAAKWQWLDAWHSASSDESSEDLDSLDFAADAGFAALDAPFALASAGAGMWACTEPAAPYHGGSSSSTVAVSSGAPMITGLDVLSAAGGSGGCVDSSMSDTDLDELSVADDGSSSDCVDSLVGSSSPTADTSDTEFGASDTEWVSDGRCGGPASPGPGTGGGWNGISGQPPISAAGGAAAAGWLPAVDRGHDAPLPPPRPPARVATRPGERAGRPSSDFGLAGLRGVAAAALAQTRPAVQAAATAASEQKANRRVKRPPGGGAGERAAPVAVVAEDAPPVCPICSGADQQKLRKKTRVRRLTAKKTPERFSSWWATLGYRGGRYCKRCSEVFRDHQLRQMSNSANCTREAPCFECAKLRSFFPEGPESIWLKYDARRGKRATAKEERQPPAKKRAAPKQGGGPKLARPRRKQNETNAVHGSIAAALATLAAIVSLYVYTRRHGTWGTAPSAKGQPPAAITAAHRCDR